jgi:hypothetical protein
MSMIDPKKQYRTRDGREVRIYAVDGGCSYPVHGAYKGDAGWVIAQWTREGCFQSNKFSNGFDLIEVKPRIRREVWVNVYEHGNGSYFESREVADRYPGSRIACVKLVIDCEEGEGL